jgi:hypothetical protein
MPRRIEVLRSPAKFPPQRRKAQAKIMSKNPEGCAPGYNQDGKGYNQPFRFRQKFSAVAP